VSKTINAWVTEVHDLAKSKGWYETDRSPLEVHMLIVSELAEATEEARKGSPPAYADIISFEGEIAKVNYESLNASAWGRVKPEGEAIELADAVIRIMDYFGARGWDLERAIELKHEYNKTRGHRHGGKRY
jgi:NTP pyrophosphatase (non-canonical NTP hydrolase)